MGHDPAEHIIEVLPRVDVAGLAGLDQAEEQGRCPCSPLAGVNGQ